MSRDIFFRDRSAVAENVLDEFFAKNCRKPNLKDRVDEVTESVVVESAGPGQKFFGVYFCKKNTQSE